MAYFDKDRTGLHKDCEVVENLSLIEYQDVLDRSAKNKKVVIKNGLNDAVKTEMELTMRDLGIDDEEDAKKEANEEAEASAGPTVDTLRNKARKLISDCTNPVKKGYFEVLKKFSLLREYQRNGFNIEGICKHPKFEKLKAQDIYKLIRGKADKINTVILTNDEAEILNTGLDATINERLKAPDMGISIPFKTMNELFRGFKLGTMMCSGMLSNAGKTRFMMSMVAHIALVEKQKTLVLLNEMDLEAVRYCLITTVINNPEFQELHGVKLHKNEREITLGLYRDANGEFIMRKTDDKGNFTETYDEYIARVSENSEEYRNVIAICNWIDETSQGLIFAKDISTDYTDKSLEFEIRKAVLTKGVKYVFYDTLKNETSSVGEWSSFKITTTKLSEIVHF